MVTGRSEDFLSWRGGSTWLRVGYYHARMHVLDGVERVFFISMGIMLFAAVRISWGLDIFRVVWISVLAGNSLRCKCRIWTRGLKRRVVERVWGCFGLLVHWFLEYGSFGFLLLG